MTSASRLTFIPGTAFASVVRASVSGITAISLKKADALTEVKLTDGTQDLIIGTQNGYSIRFHEDEARPMGRSAAGVRGIRLGKGDKVVGAVAIKRKTTTILVVAEHGFGKRSDLEEYRVSHRGGKGVFTMRATDKTGPMMAIREVLDNDDTNAQSRLDAYTVVNSRVTWRPSPPAPAGSCRASESKNRAEKK